MTDRGAVSHLPFTQHAQRLELANEVHARPSAAVAAPALVAHVAVLIGADDRRLEFAHIERLCLHFGVPIPDPGINHFSAAIGELEFVWEAHGEFSGYTFVRNDVDSAEFGDSAFGRLPGNWLGNLPGRALVAAQCLVVAQRAPVDVPALARHFGGHIVVGSQIGAGPGGAYTDFMVNADGWSRFLLAAEGLDARETGRIVQRLFEIETYRMMALLAFPIARAQGARLAGIEQALGEVLDGISATAGGDGEDEALLHEVTRLAAKVESERMASQFRFSASQAYGNLVATRIGELREQRIPGLQPIGEFMARRFDPALATCSMVARRLDGLSERIARAGGLLSTRVDITHEKQNQDLLASMDRRAKLQLRLQQTVEGLSIAAIVYYIAGLLGYTTKAFKVLGVALQPDVVVGLSIPILLLVVAFSMRRRRARQMS